MPTFQVSSVEIDFSRKAVLLDTNVLLAAFWPDDPKHQNASEFVFEVWEGELLIPISVVIETWGMLVGSRKRWDAGFKLLTWLNNPGNAVLLPQQTHHSVPVRDIVHGMRVDCVDGLLMYLADEVTEQCAFSPPLQIATYDMSDFVRCLLKYNLRISLINPDTLEEYP
jgi:hypothetical protein